MGNQQGQPPNRYQPNQGWGSPQQPPQQRQPQPNTPYPQQPYQPPPQYYQQQPFYQLPPMPPPQKKKKPPTWAYVVTGALFALVCSCIGFAVLSASRQDSTVGSTTSVTQASTMTPESLHDQIDQQITNIAQNGVLFSQHVDSNYFPDTQSVVSTELLQDWADTSGGQTEVKSDCFTIQQNIWTNHSLHLTDVEVHFTANLVDNFGHASVGMVGLCDLKTKTERQFVWSNLDGGSAWDNQDYDSETFLPPLA